MGYRHFKMIRPVLVVLMVAGGAGCADVLLIPPALLVPPDAGIGVQGADGGADTPAPDEDSGLVTRQDAGLPLDTGVEVRIDAGVVDSGIEPAIIFTEDDCPVPAHNEGWWAAAIHDGPQGPIITSSAAVLRAAIDICWIRRLEEAPVVQSEIWGDYLVLSLVPEANTDEYERLKEAHGAVREELFPSGGLLKVYFSTRYNIPALARLYQALDAVRWAEADRLFGGYNNRYEYTIEADGTWRWGAHEQFYDPFWMCGYHRTETYSVDHRTSSVRFVGESYRRRGGTCPYPWAQDDR